MNIIIVGGGQVGTYLAGLLLGGGHGVTVIEVEREALRVLERELPPGSVVAGSGTDPRVLETARIRQAHVVAAVTGTDEVNLTVTSLARFEFRVPRTVARVHNPRNAWLFTSTMGVDVAVNQAELMAHLIAEEMALSEMLTLLKLRKGEYSLVEQTVETGAEADGKAVRDLVLPSECALAAVIRGGQLLIPRLDLTLEPGDEVLAVVHADQMPQLAALLSAAPP